MLLTRVLALSAALPVLAAAQATTRQSPAQPAQPQMCDMRYQLLSLKVVDRRGAPVPGVSVQLTGIPASSEGRPPRITSERGEAFFAEDSDMRFVAPGGSKVTLTLTKGRKVRRVTLTLGRDAGGCHIAVLAGATTVTF